MVGTPFWLELLVGALGTLVCANLPLAAFAGVAGVWAYIHRRQGVPFGWGRFALFAIILHSLCLVLGLIPALLYAIALLRENRPFGIFGSELLLLLGGIIAPSVGGILGWSVVRKVARPFEILSLAEDNTPQAKDTSGS